MALTQIGKYKVLGRIGAGAMGEVFRALDTSLGREVAVKTMSTAIGGDEDLRRRFMREAQSAARLNHPNIVTVYDFGESEGQAYMAMELLVGRDLKDLIRSGSIETLDDALPLMEQICDGVGFAHSQGMVHRDLKPGNIHVLPNGQVKILDFGLARLATSDMTKTGMMLGTPNYMSPEQVRAEHVDVRSDVFSLGAVFYEMLAGRKAFEAESMHAVLYLVASKDPTALTEANPDLPVVVAKVVERALDKDPARRFQSAEQIGHAMGIVRECLNGYLDEPSALQRIEAIGTEPEAVASTLVPQPDAATVIRDSAASGPSSRATRYPIPRATWAGAQARFGSGPRSGPKGPATVPPSVSVHTLWLSLGGAAVALALIVAGIWFVWGRTPLPAPSPSPTQAAASESRVALAAAQKDLEYGNYKGALEAASAVASRDPGNPDAKRIAAAATAKLDEIETVAAALRTAREQNQRSQGQAMLQKLIALVPRHLEAQQAASWLNAAFRAEANEARGRSLRAAEQARRAPGRDADEYERARRLSREADTLVAEAKFAEATQRFTEAATRYGQAVALATPPPTPARTPAPSPTMVAIRPTPTPLPSLVATPVPSTPAPQTTTVAGAGSRSAGDHGTTAAEAVRGVLEVYRAAFERRDVNALIRVFPAEAKNYKYHASNFNKISKYEMRLDDCKVDVAGDLASATCRAVERVSPPGDTQTSQRRFRLRRDPAGWLLERVEVF